MPRKKRRIRSPHPGVVILRRELPSGRTVYQARYRDPDSARLRKPMLDSVALPTDESRRLWAVRLSKTLARRRMDLEAGAPVKTETLLSKAVGDFYAGAKDRLRPSTLRTYRHGVERFGLWADGAGIRLVEELTPARLAAFRAAIIAGDKQVAAKGRRRGSRKPGAGKRRAVTTNTYLTSAKILLNHVRVLGLAHQLSRDSISDALKPLPLPREQPEYLAPPKIEKLLRAALRHDAAVYDETRAEHAGLRPKGNTRRYEPIAPFAALLLLMGCRRGEALGLTWVDVDLDALDATGRTVGEIRLGAEHTKTHRARTIGLEVSPALRALLAAMKLRAGRNANRLHVFGGAGPYTADMVEAARDRMQRKYGAPAFDWQILRSTCATFLTNAPGIFGAATVFLSARQLGHSVAVAERHYLGVHRGIPRDAHTLEAAMQCEAELTRVIASVAGPAETNALTFLDRRRRVRA